MQFENNTLRPPVTPVLSARHSDSTPQPQEKTTVLSASFKGLAVDFLTGLASRERFEADLQRALGAVSKAQLQTACILFLDLDRFKRVNDTLGHAVGDDLLKLVSDRLRSELDPQDLIARLGGDEFAILLAPSPDRTSIEQLALRLIDLVQRPYLIEGYVAHVGASIGIAIAPEHGVSAKTLLRRADLALYESKNSGRGICNFFNPAFETKALKKRALEMELRKAVAFHQLAVFYQPQVSVETGAITGFEALLRWQHPHRGLLYPADFMPTAEEIGMTIPIGDWVLKTVCAEATHWPDEFVFAVNVTAQQFEYPAFLMSLRRALVKSGLASRRLDIEIAEDVLFRNEASVPHTLNALRELGVTITLDNFGTGVASLSLIARLPFDKIKIDQSLIAQHQDDPKSRAILRAISAMGHSLGIRTHAEGVTSKDHLERVRLDGCPSLQGFFHSDAVPVEQLAPLVHQLQNTLVQAE